MTGPLPDTETLTHDGLKAPAAGRVLILACGALAREIMAIKQLNRWTHMELACLPAIFHNTPDRIAPAVEREVLRHRRSYDRIFVAYADCGTGGELASTCDRLGVEMIAGPHCYAFFEGTDAFVARAEDEFTAFYLTDFLARQFDAFVLKPLGLDRHPELRDAYFGHYTKLVYQAQTDDPALTAMAEEAARKLDLPFERRYTGYGDLEPAIKAQV